MTPVFQKVTAMARFHDLTMNSITGEPVKFSTLKGKTCLIVNLASR
jgi:glutathione peroxidase-family protein